MSPSFEVPAHLFTEQTELIEDMESAADQSRLREIVNTGLRVLGRSALALGLATGLTVAETRYVPTPAAAVETGDYPDADAADCSATYGIYSWCKGGNDISSRGYGYKNCVDWVAYREPLATGKSVPWGLGHANTWDTMAPSSWTITSIPEAGDIAQSNGGTYGHVGVVEKVNKDSSGNITSINVSEYNHKGVGDYGVWPYDNSNGTYWRDSVKKWDNFLDLNGVGVGISGESTSGSLSDGTFLKVNESNAIYRMVGGAPIRIYNQGALPDFNGTVTNISNDQLGRLPRYPNNENDIINVVEAGNAKYRMVGGAPVRIYNCDPLPDHCAGAINVNFQSLAELDHMNARPADGSVMSISEAGGAGIYRFVGGAPVRLYNWGAISDMPNAAWVNEQSLASLDHMNARPADGSVINIVEAGGAGIYRFVGGAPIRQYNWGAIPDMPDVVTVNAESLSTLDHMNAKPADGSAVSVVEAGGSGIYEFVGGAPLRLYNWGGIPGFGNVVNINAQSVADLDHMNTVPTNGEFVASVETGAVYRIAGGAALKLYNWGSIPGYNGAVFVNQQTLDTHDHLLATPANGTTLKGVSSGALWKITDGKRSQVTGGESPVTVDEQTIANIPQS
jgi:surface antigen